MLTDREKKTLRFIKEGVLRRRRIMIMLVLCLVFIHASYLFIKKSNVKINAIQDSFDNAIIRLSGIKTTTPLEGQLKRELVELVAILDIVGRSELFVINYLILSLFSVMLILLCLAIALSGSNDNLIKKIIGSFGDNPDKLQ
ncbi:MAG: hypothetical protein NC923_05200 [Candidatus Omnitrophica bacterium]|nr:hypothetical protein [Candidatus Omnitrophota bacterium]